jgi:TRAP-type C4-dicarboxylate transport system permease small subunit
MPKAHDVADPAHRRVGVTWIANRTSALFNALGSAAIFGLMCLICADVAGRYFFNAPIFGVTEIVEISIVAIVFAQLADTTARGRLTRADGVLTALRMRRPMAARAIDVAAALIGIALMLILAYAVIPAMLNDYRQGYYIGTVGIFTFPSWPTKAVIAVGVILTALQLALSIVATLRGDNDEVAETTP